MRPLIIANWKMNPETASEARSLFRATMRAAAPFSGVKTVVCPPYPFLETLSAISGRHVSLGAQDAFWEGKGAFTGEVSPSMLYTVGCRWVILGHSERRRYLGETYEMVAYKLRAALKAGLYPVLCVGEESRDAEDEALTEVGNILETQLVEALSKIPKASARKLTVAYEPVWAISTVRGGHADTPDDAVKAVLFIRKILRRIFNKKAAIDTRVLYGGSVNPVNAHAFLREEAINGALVGSASLRPSSFATILRAAQGDG